LYAILSTTSSQPQDRQMLPRRADSDWHWTYRSVCAALVDVTIHTYYCTIYQRSSLAQCVASRRRWSVCVWSRTTTLRHTTPDISQESQVKI